MTIVSYVVEIGVCTPCHFVNVIVNSENEIFAVRKEKNYPVCYSFLVRSLSSLPSHCHHLDDDIFQQ